MKFTNEQMKWFKQYLKVQKEGKYNMITEGELARRSANLTREQYIFVIDNYKELYTQYELQK